MKILELFKILRRAGDRAKKITKKFHPLLWASYCISIRCYHGLRPYLNAASNTKSRGLPAVGIARKVSRIARDTFLWGSLALVSHAPIVKAQVQEPLPNRAPNIGAPTRPLTGERSNRPDPISQDYQVGALQADYTGSLWVGSHQGLSRINPETGKVQAKVSVPNPFIDAMAQDKVGRIWLGTPEGLIRVDPRINEITAQNFKLPSNRVLATVVDSRGFLWVGTDRGLAMISPDEGLLMTTLQALPGVSANTLTLDKKGNLWVGTLEGLVQIDTASAYLKRQVTDLPGRFCAGDRHWPARKYMGGYADWIARNR